MTTKREEYTQLAYGRGNKLGKRANVFETNYVHKAECHVYLSIKTRTRALTCWYLQTPQNFPDQIISTSPETEQPSSLEAHAGFGIPYITSYMIPNLDNVNAFLHVMPAQGDQDPD